MPETADAAPRRWRKPLLIAGALLLLIVGGGTVALLSAYPPERIAALVAEQVHANTGREIFADRGKLTYRVPPRIAVVAEGLRAANAPRGSRKESLRVERAAFEPSCGRCCRGGSGSAAWSSTASICCSRPTVRARATRCFPRRTLGVLRHPPTPRLHRKSFELDARAAQGRRHLPRRCNGASARTRELRSGPDAGGHQVDAEWVLRQQRWRASGQMARLDALIANDVEWPFDLTLTSDGARVVAKGRLLPGEASRSARLEFDVKVDKAAALAPWTADASAVPLPIERSRHSTCLRKRCAPTRCRCRSRARRWPGASR